MWVYFKVLNVIFTSLYFVLQLWQLYCKIGLLPFRHWLGLFSSSCESVCVIMAKTWSWSLGTQNRSCFFFPGVYKSVCGQISVNTTASQPCKMQSGNFTGVQSYKLPAPCPAGVPETHIVVGLFFQVFIGLYLCLSGSSSVCSWDDNQDSVPRWVPGLQKNSRFWFQVYHVE